MIRTIIVDDEILSRIGIQSFIDGKQDITVEGVFEGAEDALEFLREKKVDIVITDIEMAQMNGLDFIRQIRKECLAAGVIILSCHDDFSYAQEAISSGTDSYLLKYSITEEKILNEIQKVYEKTRSNLQEDERKKQKKEQEEIEAGTYQVVRFKVQNEGKNPSPVENMDSTMLIHLLEGILKRYEMGTLFTPFDQEMFILFQFPLEVSKDELQSTAERNLALIQKNMEQYITATMVFGISSFFTDLKETRSRYREAEEALNMCFYEPGQAFFYYRKMSGNLEEVSFSAEHFLEQDAGILTFERELEQFLQNAYFKRISVQRMKDLLIQGMMMLHYQILKEYQLEEELLKKWKSSAIFIGSISQASNVAVLKEELVHIVKEFQQDIREALVHDELREVFSYIEKNLDQKIALTDLTEICCMSVPSFSKKFKERTGMTTTEYINERRIERAKILLKNQKYSLWEIAEQTGFSNTNYLIRVFKKMTGQTVGEYRQKYGISEETIPVE